MVQLPLGALLPSGHSHWHHQGRLLLLPCGAGCGLLRLPESAGSPRQCRWPQPLVLPPELNRPQPPSAGAPAPSLPSCSPCCSWLENGHGSWTLIPGRHSAHLGGVGAGLLCCPCLAWNGVVGWFGEQGTVEGGPAHTPLGVLQGLLPSPVCASGKWPHPKCQVLSALTGGWSRLGVPAECLGHVHLALWAAPSALGGMIDIGCVTLVLAPPCPPGILG